MLHHVKQHDSKSYLFDSEKRDYEITTRNYNLPGHKGKLDVPYPLLKSSVKNMTVVNRIIQPL